METIDAPHLDIRPLNPHTWPDLATLFEEGGDPRSCWCMYWRMRSKDFSASSAGRKRAALRELAAGQTAPGLIAYRDGRAVGWVSLGPRDQFGRLERSRTLARTDGRPVWSIVCFAVSRGDRGQGVARELLAGAIEYARGHGAPALEAFPVATGGARVHPDSAYTGTLPMFQDAGFQIVKESASSADGRPRVIVRLDLGRS